MDRLELGAKKLGLHLDQKQLEQFSAYYRELIDWNRRINLTTVTDYDEVQIKHFLDSLTVTLAWSPQKNSAGARLIDVGSGAGMPGLPLKILFPDIRLTLLEATAKKAVFLNHLKDKLKLNNAEIITGRAEEIAHLDEYREGFDIVLARAVAPLPALAELSLPFLKLGGSFIAQKKGAIEREIHRASKAIENLGGSLRGVVAIDLEEFPDERRLVVIEKISPTPPKYPRRPGIPAKRPLI